MTSFSFSANNFQEVVEQLNQIIGAETKEKRTDEEWLKHLNSYHDLSRVTFKAHKGNKLYRAVSKKQKSDYFVEVTMSDRFYTECIKCGNIFSFDKDLHDEHEIEDKENYICYECRKQE